jgi:hypothetical protein
MKTGIIPNLALASIISRNLTNKVIQAQEFCSLTSDVVASSDLVILLVWFVDENLPRCKYSISESITITAKDLCSYLRMTEV